jgi:hypothetical protein
MELISCSNVASFEDSLKDWNAVDEFYFGRALPANEINAYPKASNSPLDPLLAAGLYPLAGFERPSFDISHL